MKKIVCVFLSLFSILHIVEAQKVVKVGAFNFYPGIFQDNDGEIKGFYVDALNELGRKENIKFVYVYGSWDEGLEHIKTGEIDVLTSVAITGDRMKYMDYTPTPLLTVWSEVYTIPKSEIHGILDLEGKTIAIMKSDYNGGHLKQLIEKLEINCSFVEVADFEEVFNLINDKKVDAGVVNNTFGAPKSAEYGLLSTGIILNPFDIFLTVKKDSNKELLELLNKYLHNWEHDRNSVFNVARQKWSHEKIGSIEVIPKWLEKVIYSALFIVLILFLFINLLRYKVKIARKRIEHSEQLFRTFMENTPAYVYIKDSSLNHVYRNRMVNLVNNTSADEQNSSAKTIFEPHIAELVEKTDQQILNLRAEQINLQYECKLNNKKIWLHDYKFFIQLPNDKPGIGGVSFDITKLKETEFELINAKEKAEESDLLKSAFLANMSHEIRTPMNGILGFAELLKEPELSSNQQKEYLRIIEKSGARMLNIINEIMDISKIEAGMIIPEIKEFDLNEQIEYVYNFFKPEANAKGIELFIKNSLPAKEAVLLSDREKLNAVLINLVKNAIKYTDKGSIEFGFNKKDDFLEYYVKDTGIGIHKDRLDVIFERFIQADISDVQARQGAGLGLTISKAYVEMLGGQIWIESVPEMGSTFYFNIPYKVQGKQEIESENQIIPLIQENPVKNLKFLIAEDDEISKMFISIIVSPIGKEILKARNGKEAIEICRNNPDIDIILMDIQMPDLNGYEATRQIRQFNKDVIIIAQTAFGLSGDREKSIAAGCNDYISKPVKKDELLSLIQKHFMN